MANVISSANREEARRQLQQIKTNIASVEEQKRKLLSDRFSRKELLKESSVSDRLQRFKFKKHVEKRSQSLISPLMERQQYLKPFSEMPTPQEEESRWRSIVQQALKSFRKGVPSSFLSGEAQEIVKRLEKNRDAKRQLEQKQKFSNNKTVTFQLPSFNTTSNASLKSSDPFKSSSLFFNNSTNKSIFGFFR